MRESCEMLVRVVDKTNEDVYLDAQCTKAGDVIAIMPGGHEWGRAEVSGSYRVVAVSCDARYCQQFMSPEIAHNPGDPSRVMQRRGFRLRVSALPMRQFDVSRGHAYSIMGPYSAEEVHLCRFRVQPLKDPNIL